MYFTSEERTDGFGSQFQSYIHMIYYASVHNGEYIHIPIKTIEHNYSNDVFYEKQLEELMRTSMFKSIDEIDTTISEVRHITNKECRDYFDSNPDDAMSHISLTSYKSVFWSNISNDFYNNDKFNIAVHIRRGDVEMHINGDRYMPNEYYMDKIAYLSNIYADKDIMFHIYSEGREDEFACFTGKNTVLHLNEDTKTTFIGLVSSNALVHSKSSFSYVAGLLSRGTVYYLPFWHPPLSSWIMDEPSYNG